MFRRTKIVATLGPASGDAVMIEKLIHAGVNVFRLNFSHGKKEDHRERVNVIRELSKKVNRPIAILQDLQGPKIRTATFADGKIELVEGESFRLTCQDDSPGTVERVGVTYKGLCNDVHGGDELLLDDGRLRLLVTGIEGDSILTKVLVGGTLSNNKGINIPNADLSIPALTDKDVEDLQYGAELDVDWVAMSFVRSRDDLLLARHYLARSGSRARLMAKIEKPSAVKRFDDILREVDGIMVARGDLGVELPAEQVPPIQKQLIHACVEAGKPVITATQMLESMIQSPTPTRAEASDVANAIYDGTDAVMLSGETAVGKYPIEAVRMMDRIARTVESDLNYQQNMRSHAPRPGNTTPDAVAYAACQIAISLPAELIVVFSSSGNTALRVSRYRPPKPILTITPNERAYRQMAVVWGVRPALNIDIHSTDEMVASAEKVMHDTLSDEIKEGDRYVVTAGVPFGMRGTTNMIRVERVKPKL
ncbi:MAG: pyruvate kinase [Deinococcales bacterium]